MNYVTGCAATRRPDRSQVFDTEHATLDDALAEMTNRLTAAQYAYMAYEQSARDDAARANLNAVVDDVRELINRACDPMSRQAVALKAYYLTYPPITYADIQTRYPTYFRTDGSVQRAMIQGEAAVAQGIYDEMRLTRKGNGI